MAPKMSMPARPSSAAQPAEYSHGDSAAQPANVTSCARLDVGWDYESKKHRTTRERLFEETL